MLIRLVIRNGTIKSITEIVHSLNNAKLDPKTGMLVLLGPSSSS